MNIAIIGSSGFIGRSLVKGFLNNGDHVLGVDISEEEELLDPNYEFIRASVTKTGDFPFDRLVEIDCLIYLVSTTTPSSSNLDMIQDIEDNQLAFVRFLEKIVALNVKKIIFSSSGGAIYSNEQSPPYSEISQVSPVSSYGINKLACEMYLRLFNLRYGLSYISLRLSNPYGEGQLPKPGFGVIPTFVNASYTSEPIQVYGNGGSVRDFIYIEDVVDAFVVAANSPNTGVYNVGSGAPSSINDIITLIEGATGNKFIKYNVDARACDLSSVYLDVSKMSLEMNWKPTTSLRTGLIKYINWHKKLKEID